MEQNNIDEGLFTLHIGIDPVPRYLLLNEGLKQLAKLAGIMRPVDDGGTRSLVVLGLSSEVATKELDDVCRYTCVVLNVRF
jgi:hypothetical protein